MVDGWCVFLKVIEEYWKEFGISGQEVFSFLLYCSVLEVFNVFPVSFSDLGWFSNGFFGSVKTAFPGRAHGGEGHRRRHVLRERLRSLGSLVAFWWCEELGLGPRMCGLWDVGVRECEDNLCKVGTKHDCLTDRRVFRIRASCSKLNGFILYVGTASFGTRSAGFCTGCSTQACCRAVQLTSLSKGKIRVWSSAVFKTSVDHSRRVD